MKIIKIIGYAYKYIPSIKDFGCFNSHIKYLENKTLVNILSLHFYYRQLNNQLYNNKDNNNIANKKYYLINHKLMNDIKIECNYKHLKDDIDNIKELNEDIFNNISLKNIYSLLQKLPDYSVKKNIENEINKYMNIQIEPDIIPIYYFDHKKQAQASIMIFNNFENYIINNNLLDCFFIKKILMEI